MSRIPSQQSLARRAMVEDPAADRSGWALRGVAVLGVSVLGLGMAGSAALTGNAHDSTASQTRPSTATALPAPSVSTSVAPGVALPSAFDRRSVSLSRSAQRPSLAASVVSGGTDRRTLGSLVSADTARGTAQAEAVRLRDASLGTIAESTDRKDQSLRKARAKAEKVAKAVKAEKAAKAAKEKAARARAARAAEAKADRAAEAKADRAAEAKADRAAEARADQAKQEAKEARADKAEKSGQDDKADDDTATKGSRSESDRGSGSASLPITSGYNISARFGDTGSWSRYHTGLDFAAPRGTTIHAAASGTVTHAGSGSAGWAGHYVTIRHSDGKTSLYAHMSTVSVHEGEHVSGGQKVGAVGMTGRTFGPHVHFEIYPAGAKVGSPYKAINPSPWLRARGLHF